MPAISDRADTIWRPEEDQAVRKSRSQVSLAQTLIVIGVLMMLAVVSFSSGYVTAWIQKEEARTLRAIYHEAAPRPSEVF